MYLYIIYDLVNTATGDDALVPRTETLIGKRGENMERGISKLFALAMLGSRDAQPFAGLAPLANSLHIFHIK